MGGESHRLLGGKWHVGNYRKRLENNERFSEFPKIPNMISPLSRIDG